MRARALPGPCPRRAALAPAIAAASLLAAAAVAAGARPARAEGALRAAASHLVSIRDSPGYVPLADPDSAAERLGRRPGAPLVEKRLRGGAGSLEGLGAAVLGAFHAGNVDSMLALCVRSDEFRDILWPEFPQSRPATGLRWDDAWMTLFGRLNGGSVSSVRQWADHYYTLLRIERSARSVRYRNFTLHNGITLVAKDDEGHVVRYAGIRSVVERRGRFKIYSMAD